MEKLAYHYHQPSMDRSRLFITSWATAVLLVFQIRLHHCTWFDLKILLQSCIFPLSELDSNIETALHYKLCNRSLSILKTFLYHPMNCRVCFSTSFPTLYSRTSLWIFQWQNILSLICNWISHFYDKWGFTEINEIQLQPKIVLCWHSALWNREV